MKRLAGVVGLVCAMAGGAAWSQPTDKQAATAAYDEGQRHYAAADYLPAAEQFEAAYALDPDPAYLYNIAQAYRLGKACTKAADYYRRFLAVVPNPKNLDKVTRYLDESDACAKTEVTVAPPPDVKPAPEVIVQPVPAPVARVDRHAADDDRGRSRRRLGIAVGVAGVAAIGVGVWFTHDVHTLEGYSDAICTTGMACIWDATKQARADDIHRRGDRASDLELGAYAIGGAALVSGAILYVLGAGASSERVTVAPMSGGAAVSARFRF